LAVTGNLRMEILPNVPSFTELGIPEIGLSWLAVMAPKGTLPEAVTAMNREIQLPPESLGRDNSPLLIFSQSRVRSPDR